MTYRYFIFANRRKFGKSIGKFNNQTQVAAHCLDVTPKSREQEIGTILKFRYASLAHVEKLRHALLGELARLAQRPQRLFFRNKLLRPRSDLRALIRWQRCDDLRQCFHDGRSFDLLIAKPSMCAANLLSATVISSL